MAPPRSTERVSGDDHVGSLSGLASTRHLVHRCDGDDDRSDRCVGREQGESQSRASDRVTMASGGVGGPPVRHPLFLQRRGQADRPVALGSDGRGADQHGVGQRLGAGRTAPGPSDSTARPPVRRRPPIRRCRRPCCRGSTDARPAPAVPPDRPRTGRRPIGPSGSVRPGAVASSAHPPMKRLASRHMPHAETGPRLPGQHETTSDAADNNRYHGCS